MVPVMSAALRPGDVLAGKYLVERVLGVGGMGVVVAAKHRRTSPGTDRPTSGRPRDRIR